MKNNQISVIFSEATLLIGDWWVFTHNTDSVNNFDHAELSELLVERGKILWHLFGCRLQVRRINRNALFLFLWESSAVSALCLIVAWQGLHIKFDMFLQFYCLALIAFYLCIVKKKGGWGRLGSREQTSLLSLNKGGGVADNNQIHTHGLHYYLLRLII